MKATVTNRVYCRLLADGTIIGPYYTKEWLWRVVASYKWFRRFNPGDLS